MVPRSVIPTALLFLSLTGCGVPQDQYDLQTKELQALRVLADSLRQIVDDLEHGASRMLAKSRLEWANGNRGGARAAASDVISRHPDAPEAVQARTVVAMADSADSSDARRARAEATARERERAAALGNLRKKRDEMGGYTTYRARTAPEFVNSRSWVTPYIFDLDRAAPRLKLTIYYLADDWLFIDSYRFKVDGVDYVFVPGEDGSEDVERDNGDGEIWEWWTIDATDGEARRFLEALANSKQATMRYDGRQYYKDRTISQAEREGAKQILLGFDVLQSQ